MLFFIVILAGLALWAVIAAALAWTHDGRGAISRGRTAEERRGDHPLLTDPRFFAR